MCVFHSQQPLATEKTCVTHSLYHMVDNLNITNHSGFGRKRFETLWDRTWSGEREREKCAMDFLSKKKKHNYRLNKSWQCPTTNRTKIGGGKTLHLPFFTSTKPYCAVSEDKQRCMWLVRETCIAGLTAT